MSARDTIYLLCHDAENNPNYASWIGSLELAYRVVDKPTSDWELPHDAAVIVTHNQYRYDEVNILRRAREQQIPTLVLADGILEYRNTWENPSLPKGAIYQPVIGHKLACIGRSQMRLIETWNDPGICELVGIPRLDGYLQSHPSSRVKAGEFRILIATARTPGFTPEQMAITRQSLLDMRDWFAAHPNLHDERVKITWRISPELAESLHVDVAPHDVEGDELIHELDKVDAVITTPSTVALEGMLTGRPVVWLDYHQVPPLIGVVWSIQCKSQIASVVHELFAPPPQKLELQRTFLFDSLECQSPAKDRLIRLVSEMARLGSEAHQQQRELTLPQQILFAEAGVDQQALFCGDASTSLAKSSAESSDLARSIRIELDHAHRKISELNSQLEAVREDLQQRNHDVRKLGSKAERLESQVEEARAQQQAAKAEFRQAREDLAKKTSELSEFRRQFNEQKRTAIQLTNRLAIEAKAVERLRDETKQTRRELSRRTREQETLAVRIEQVKERLTAQRDYAQRLTQQLSELTSHWLVGSTIRMARLRVDVSDPPNSSSDDPSQELKSENSDDSP